MKKIMRVLSHRLVLVSLLILFQLALLIFAVLRYSRYFVFYNAFCITLSFISIPVILNRRTDPGYKIAWIIPILIMPVFGWLMYLLFGGNKTSRRTRKKMARIQDRLAENGVTSFSELFKPGMHKTTLVGIFLASLELVRNYRVEVEQYQLFGEIWLHPGEGWTREINGAGVTSA